MTMDLKEIIKWFIPCFHILLFLNRKMDVHMTFCLFLFFNLCLVNGATVNKELGVSESIDNAKYVDLDKSNFNQSSVSDVMADQKGLLDESVGRTFGRPFKKMVGSLMPLIFQIGAASTWAVVAAIVGVKTLFVTLLILKLLLVAGAAKFGALLASKGHQSHGHGWEPHQKEIHLHIHNGQVSHDHEHDEHSIVPWSRDSSQQTDKNYNVYMEPYVASGPQTISTPFGNYIKIGSRNFRKK